MGLVILAALIAVAVLATAGFKRLQQTNAICGQCTRRSGHEVRGHSEQNCLSTKPCHHGCTGHH